MTEEYMDKRKVYSIEDIKSAIAMACTVKFGNGFDEMPEDEEVIEQVSKKFEKHRNLNIGIIGHIDHGKTTMAAALIDMLQQEHNVHIINGKSFDEKPFTIRPMHIDITAPYLHDSVCLLREQPMSTNPLDRKQTFNNVNKTSGKAMKRLRNKQNKKK